MSVVDLRAAFDREGALGAVLELVTRWLGVEVPEGPTTGVGLLALLRSDEVFPRLKWPQDRVLPATSDKRVGGEAVIAEENQILWQAVVTDPSGPGTVGFIVDDGQRRLDEDMALDELLLRISVESVVRSAQPQLRCTVVAGDGGQEFKLLEDMAIASGLLVFGDLAAGPGWFGVGRLQPGGRLSIATKVDPVGMARSEALWSRDWERMVLREDRGPDPWAAPPKRPGSPWQPV